MKIHLLDEVLLNNQVISTDELDLTLFWGESFPLGFARIEAVSPNQLFLNITQSGEFEVELVPGLKTPVMVLDGKKVSGPIAMPFSKENKFEAYFIYDRKYYVTRQTVTLVSE